MAIGAGIGLLFAPRAGAEMRGHIADSASTVGKRMSETFDTVADAGRDAYHQARDVATTAGEQIGRMASDVSRSAQEGADAIRAAASRTRRDTSTSTHA
jgi:gas vesicle protein